MAIGQYLKDTRAELRHVAWPTRTQTIIYTVLVALVSIGVALYLGLFDFLFTTGLTKAVTALKGSSLITVEQQPTSNSNDLIQTSPITIVGSSTNPQ